MLHIPTHRFCCRVPALTITLLFLVLAGCADGRSEGQQVDELYQQAASSGRRGEYAKALDYYDQALALDTLQVDASRAALALYEKMVLEARTGEYYAALRSAKRLEQQDVPELSDSLRKLVAVEKATLLRELGNFKEAAATLEAIDSPTPETVLELADLRLAAGEGKEAVRLFARFSGREQDPVLRITAQAGLLRCKVAYPDAIPDTAHDLAVLIATESKRVLAKAGDPLPKLHALRIAANSLLLLDEERRNASYLLFRSLMLAEESGNQFLIHLLRMESNAVIVRNGDAFRELADYFRVVRLQYAQALSLYMLAGSEGVTDAERMTSLRQGLSLCRDYAPPHPDIQHRYIEAEAAERLRAIVMRKSRLFELFDAQEKIGTTGLQRIMQQYPGTFVQHQDNDAVHHELRRLLHEIAALLQRKSDIITRGQGLASSGLIDRMLNIKRGRLLELVTGLRQSEPVLADALLASPVTLQKVQQLLCDDQAIIAPVEADSLAGALLITNKRVQFSSVPMVASATASLQQHGGDEPDDDFGTDTLPLAMLPPFTQVAGLRHIVIINDANMSENDQEELARLVQVRSHSQLGSFREFALLGAHVSSYPLVRPVRIYRQRDLASARLHKLLHPVDAVYIVNDRIDSVVLEGISGKLTAALAEGHTATEALSLLQERDEVHYRGTLQRDFSVLGNE